MEKVKSTVERRSLILQQLEIERQVDVNSLCKKFGVSEVTIRNDLNKLEKKKMLIRTRGGAIKLGTEYIGSDRTLSEKQQSFLTEKQNIGKLASSLIKDGETIILDSGTTTFEIAKNLSSHQNVVVITNALNIAILLSEYKNVKTIVPGGILRDNSLSLIGAPAEENIKNYFCDKLFIGVDGFDISHGISTPNIEEAHLCRTMISIAKQVICVTDSSKFSKRGFAFIAPVKKIHKVITDKGIGEEVKNGLLKEGIEVLVV